MSFYSFKYNLSIVNVIFMKNRRLYEIDGRYGNNSVVFYFLLHLLVNLHNYARYLVKVRKNQGLTSSRIGVRTQLTV